MTSTRTAPVWRPSRVGIVAAILSGGGILLAVTANMSFLILAALGTFGPGILRELGWLRDQDEFQRQAARRAGYHAYLTGGFLAIVLIALLRAGQANLDDAASMTAALLLVILWLTWLFSALMDYLDPQRAASRTLVVFGLFWLMFVVLSHATEPTHLLAEGVVVIPFFALAWVVRRWPRLGGVLLLAVAAGTTVLFRFFQLADATPEQVLSKALTFALFEVPLVASALALLRVSPDRGAGED